MTGCSCWNLQLSLEENLASNVKTSMKSWKHFVKNISFISQKYSKSQEREDDLQKTQNQKLGTAALLEKTAKKRAKDKLKNLLLW